MKRMSSPAATLAFQRSSEKLSVPSEPADAVGTPRRATARATFQPAPPGRDSQFDAPVRIRSVRISPAETNCGKVLRVSMLISRSPLFFQCVQDFVARAHRVIVGLAGGAFFVAVFAVVAREDPVPRAMLVIHEMLPAIAPEFVVAIPETLAPRAFAEQRGGGEGFGLHPEVFVVVADGIVGAETVVQAAVLVIP